MRMHYSLLSLLILISCLAINIRTFQNNHIDTTQEPSTKPIIIFDLINVLFKENYAGFAKKIGYSTLASYALTHWKNPGHRCLDMLEEMCKHNTQKPQVEITVLGRTMPQCFVDLQKGTKNCKETTQEIKEAIAHLDTAGFFSSIKEKNIMTSLMELMLNPNLLPLITEPIKQMVQLAQTLQKKGYDMYLCVNIPAEFYTALEKQHPNIIALFKGAIVSSQVNMVKPEKEIFEHLISTYKLDPAQCIVIDNQQSSINTAVTLGMKGILFDKMNQLMSGLQKLGVKI